DANHQTCGLVHDVVTELGKKRPQAKVVKAKLGEIRQAARDAKDAQLRQLAPNLTPPSSTATDKTAGAAPLVFTTAGVPPAHPAHPAAGPADRRQDAAGGGPRRRTACMTRARMLGVLTAVVFAGSAIPAGATIAAGGPEPELHLQTDVLTPGQSVAITGSGW